MVEQLPQSNRSPVQFRSESFKKESCVSRYSENGVNLNHLQVKFREIRGPKPKVFDVESHGGPQAFTARKADGS